MCQIADSEMLSFCNGGTPTGKIRPTNLTCEWKKQLLTLGHMITGLSAAFLHFCRN